MKEFKSAQPPILKRLTILIITLIFAACAFPARTAFAAADGRQYARADMRNCYFCKDMNPDTALFALPYTYCVEILNDQGEWYLVRYAENDGFYRSVTGYCLKEGLTLVDVPPENTYLSYPVTAVLHSDVDESLPGLEMTITAAYYGVYYKGASAYSYVLYDDTFYYISGANEDYPLNEIPSEPTFSPAETPDDDSARVATALIVTAIAAAAIVILIITGKKKVK